MLHLPGDMFGPRIQGPDDMVLYFRARMATDTLKIELRDAARSVASNFVEFFTPIVYLNLLVEITIDVASELNGIYEEMFGFLLDLGAPYV